MCLQLFACFVRIICCFCFSFLLHFSSKCFFIYTGMKKNIMWKKMFHWSTLRLISIWAAAIAVCADCAIVYCCLFSGNSCANKETSSFAQFMIESSHIKTFIFNLYRLHLFQKLGWWFVGQCCQIPWLLMHESNN